MTDFSGAQLGECWRGPIGPWPEPLRGATIQGCDPRLPGHAACAQRVRATASATVCPAHRSEERVAPRCRARATSSWFGTKGPSGVGRPAGSRWCSRWLWLVRWRPAQVRIRLPRTELRPVVRSALPPRRRACRRDERLTRSSSLLPMAGDWPWRAGAGEPDRAPGDRRHQHRGVDRLRNRRRARRPARACAPTTAREPAPVTLRPTSDGTPTTP